LKLPGKIHQIKGYYLYARKMELENCACRELRLQGTAPAGNCACRELCLQGTVPAGNCACRELRLQGTVCVLSFEHSDLSLKRKVEMDTEVYP
jgi:hypothetical protein